MRTSRIVQYVVFGLLCGWLAGVSGRAAAADALPADLDAVPRNAACFVHFRAAELWNHEAFADVRYLFKRADSSTLKTFREMFEPNPANINRVTLVMPTPREFNEPSPYIVRPESTSVLVIVRTKKPFDYLRVIEKLAFRDKFYRRHHYYFNEEGWRTLVMIDAQTFLFGTEQSMFHYFDLMDNSEATESGPLQTALEEATGKQHVTVGVHPQGFAKMPGYQFMPPALRPMFAARCWIGKAHMDRAIKVDVRMEFTDEKKSQAGEQSAQAAIKLGRSSLKMGLVQLQQQFLQNKEKTTFADLPMKFSLVVGMGFLREVDRILTTLPVQRNKKTIVASLKYDKLNITNNATIYLGMVSMAGSWASATFNTVGNFGGVGKGDPREQHLKRIAGALEKYHQDKGSYPPPAIYDKHGRPVLSWRVALLPYFGQQERTLHGQFRLVEPWDGPNNKKLIAKLPQCFRAPNYYDYRSQGKTIDVVFTGKGTIFEGPKGTHKKDVLPKTALLLMVSSQVATYWTKPGDVRIDPGKPLPKLFPQFGDEMYALLADGSFTSIIPLTIGEKELRAMIYRAKGKVAADPEPKYPAAAWNDFIQIDDHGARRALRAVRKLAAAPESSVPFLKSKFKAAPRMDPKRIDALINDLGSTNFRTRSRANAELTKAGLSALNALTKKLRDGKLELETRMRVVELVKKAQSADVTPDDLRAVRSVLVLQQIGNAEARSVLAQWAKGADGAVLTASARKALRILGQR